MQLGRGPAQCGHHGCRGFGPRRCEVGQPHAGRRIDGCGQYEKEARLTRRDVNVIRGWRVVCGGPMIVCLLAFGFLMGGVM